MTIDKSNIGDIFEQKEAWLEVNKNGTNPEKTAT